MEEAVDGEYQTFKANDGAYVREHFFGSYPETKAMVADWTDARSGRSAAAGTIRGRSTPRTTLRSATPASRP